MRQVKDVLVAREEAVLGEERTKLPNLVEEEIGVPMLAIEFVPFDIREDPVRQRNHLVVGRALFFSIQQLSIVLNELATFSLQLLDGPIEGFARLDPFDVPRE